MRIRPHSEWKAWGKCSKKCGGGIQNRWRACNNPRPARGGKACDGQHKESQSCNTHSCQGIKSFDIFLKIYFLKHIDEKLPNDP